MTYYEAAPNNFTPMNLGSAFVGGVEFELRKTYHLSMNHLEILLLM